MSVVSRTLLAGLICAAMGAQAFAAPASDDPGSTKGRFFHASKCVVTLGFSGGCDKDQADSKVAAEKQAAEKAKAAQSGGVTKVADDHSTRHQFARASKCVVTFGFVGDCDKNAPEGSAKASAAEQRADAAPAALDNSTKGRFFHASKCVVTLGFGGRCDEK
jgi:hypothetical protein